MTIIVGEDAAFSRGGEGIAAAVRKTLASGLVDADDSDSVHAGGGGGGGGGGGEGGEGAGWGGGDGVVGVGDGRGERLLSFANAVVLAKGGSG